MTNLDIKINILKLSSYVGKKGIGDKKLSLMVEYFSHYILNLYGRVIESEINSRRYRGKWEPVDDPGYLEYIGVTPERPMIDLIAEALEVVKIGYNYIVRINPRYMYPGTRIPLMTVLRAIESGTSKFNARPILAKSTREINKNIVKLWKGYLKMKGVL